MSRNPKLDNLDINRFYRLQAIDILLFGYIRASKEANPNISLQENVNLALQHFGFVDKFEPDLVVRQYYRTLDLFLHIKES